MPLQQIEITSINQSSLGDLLDRIASQLENINDTLQGICRAIDSASRAR